MDFINHYDNGTRGLRIAASVCMVLGWIILGLSVIATFAAAHEIAFGILFLGGVGIWCTMYLTACAIRAVATITEAAQGYIDKNKQEDE
jgi:hypothetical protein